MFITRMSLPRRTFLRGLGATVALPMLEAMVPAVTAGAAANPVCRFGAIYTPHGNLMQQWTPATAGPSFELTPILKPLEPFRDRLVVVSNLGLPVANGGAHAVAPSLWLSAAWPKKTEAEDVHAGTTVDQIIAKAIGQDTQFPSLEVAIEDFTGYVGACDTGYSCTYANTISWQTPTTPLPMEINPRIVFERMFGGTGTAAERLVRMQENRSILDVVVGQAKRLQTRVGPRDRARLSEYLDNVREIERRLERAEQQSESDLAVPEVPIGVPDTFAQHVGLMFDLLALAFQADITRVFTFMMSRELSARTYPEVGISDSHHSLSHHRNNPARMAKFALVNTYYMQLFGKFLEKLQTTPDGGGSLLDHSMILYGSGMASGDLHNHHPLPNIVAGRGAGRITGGRHLLNPELTPLGNLHLTLAQKAGVEIDRFGDSTGTLGF